MKVAFIEPVAELQYASQGDIHMVLPEAMNHVDYVNYYRHNQEYKILDNGNAEGKELGWLGLINMAQLVNAAEVVVPDEMGDSTTTQEKAIKFGNWLKYHEHGEDFNFMGVAHGKNMAEVISCIHTFASLDYISVLGLPRLLANTIHRHARVTLMESPELMEVIATGFPGGVHCLGASTFVKEAILLADLPVRSIDTSLPASMTLAAREISRHPYTVRPDNFWNATYKEKGFLPDINHGRYKEWCIGQNVTNGGY